MYHKYWTLNLRHLAVYPKVLFHSNFSIKDKVAHSLSATSATAQFYIPSQIVASCGVLAFQLDLSRGTLTGPMSLAGNEQCI